MNKTERMQRTEKKLNQRKQMMNSLGIPEGSMYVNTIQKRSAKIRASLGYVRDGHISHYLGISPSKKTKNSASVRNSGPSWARKRGYGAKMNYRPHDERQILRETDEVC